MGKIKRERDSLLNQQVLKIGKITCLVLGQLNKLFGTFEKFYVKQAWLLLLLMSFSTLIIGCEMFQPPQPPAEKLAYVPLLPLEIDTELAFRKHTQFLNDPATFLPSRSEAVDFLRRSYMWPATTDLDKNELKGEYFDFYWWNHGSARKIIFRFEYRQAGLGNQVFAYQIVYPEAHGSIRSSIKIIGDDYLENGPVSSWRALLIEDGHIAGVTQSFLWR